MPYENGEASPENSYIGDARAGHWRRDIPSNVVVRAKAGFPALCETAEVSSTA